MFPKPFKKLHPEILEKLTSLEITAPTPLQTKSIPVIKSGSDLYCTAPEGSGKTTTLVLTTLQKLGCEAAGNTPRAMVLAKDKESALDLQDKFMAFTKHNSLRVYVGHEKMHVDLQKSEIMMGVDILISTPKSLNNLFLLNGVNTSELKIFSVDDAEFLIQQSNYAALISITQMIQKCQYVLYSEKMHPKLKRFESNFMEYAKTISL